MIGDGVTSLRGGLECYTRNVRFRGETYEVTLSSRKGKPYHSFEVSLGNFYIEGCLEIETINGVHYVEGYDGVYCLPMAVAMVLADLGYGFAPYVFPTDAI